MFYFVKLLEKRVLRGQQPLTTILFVKRFCEMTKSATWHEKQEKLGLAKELPVCRGNV